ncbi:MAG: hypothetical protein Kow0090_14410 [Myxococcota bacterium]
MKIDRRGFLRFAIASGVLTFAARANGNEKGKSANDDSLGALMDITLCIGCRKCEQACNQANNLPPPKVSFEDKSVFEKERRMTAEAYTVVNQYIPKDGDKPLCEHPVYVKLQCMHCNDPACVSACIVGALTKERNGAVIYDKDKCIGCRYCMVACPFQVPAYEYFNPLTPQVRKCTFCFDRLKKGERPACVSVCTTEAIAFGKRSELLELAKTRLKDRPERYTDVIYGEKEVGGTSWMYLSPVPFEKIGFLKLPETAPPRLTEAIQHGIFKYFIPPLALYTTLGLAMHLFKERKNESTNKTDGGK